MPISASKLRENIYKVLDEVLETGNPAQIIRRGKRLKIVPADPVKPTSKLQRLKRRKGVLKGNPDALVHLDWSKEWNP